MENKIGRASKKNILLYSFGGIGSNTAFWFVLMYASYFFIDILGIDPLQVGLLLLIPRFIDAFTDPLMGMIADKTKTKIGKYRPFVAYFAPILGLSISMLFVDFGLSGTTELIVCYVLYITYTLVSTAVNIPYHSLTPVITGDSSQVSSIAVSKQVFSTAAMMGVQTFVPLLLKANEGNDGTLQSIAIVAGIIITIAFWICQYGAKDADNAARWENEEVKEIKFFEQFKLIYKNKPLLMLMIAAGTDMLAIGATAGIAVMYFRDFVGNIGIMATVGTFGLFSLGANLFVPMISKKLGKKKLYLIAACISTLASTTLFFVPSTGVAFILACLFIVKISSGYTNVLSWAMLADCVEYGEWVTGIRGAGTVSSQLTFVNKLGSALGGFILGALLSAGGYVAGAEVQSASAIKTIVGMQSLLPAAGYLASIIAMSMYPITEEFYAKMVKENRERK